MTFSSRSTSPAEVDSRKGESLWAALCWISDSRGGVPHRPVGVVWIGLLHNPVERGVAALELLCKPPLAVYRPSDSKEPPPSAALNDELVDAEEEER